MPIRLTGQAWKFGANVDTDQMAPFTTFSIPWKETKPAMFPNRPMFHEEFEPGDIIVAEGNWGCGSSREQAPANLKLLGVGAIVAESFARIFYRNAVALALPCLECPGIAAAVAEGDELMVDLEAGLVRNLTQGTELVGSPPNADMLRIIDSGGLLQELQSHDGPPPARHPASIAAGTRKLTMAEKVLSRASGGRDVMPGDYVTAQVDRLIMGEFTVSCASRLRKLGIRQFFDPERVVQTITAVFPAPDETIASLHTKVRAVVKEYGITHFYPHDGIINQVAVEKGEILPGELVFGSDSHSTTYGALGCAGAGLGTTELTYLLARGEIWLRVPETIRFEITGVPGAGFMSKDLILYLLARFGSDYAQYRAIEFGGSFAGRMTLASRMTLCNMGAEMGAKFAMFEADAKTLDYLDGRTDQTVNLFGPDPGADYKAVHEIDVSSLEPQVARPHNPANGGPVSEAAGVKVNQAFIGSCTNSRLEDLQIAAAIVKGRKVASTTRLIVTPSSQEVLLQAIKAGYVETLVEAGAHFTPTGCGACSGGVGGIVGPGEVGISTTNRNFRGRMGSAGAELYLGSPATVAASAIAGEIVDPRDFWPAHQPGDFAMEADWF